MPVDPRKPRVVLIVHGVQIGRNKDQNQHRDIERLIKSRLGNLPLSFRTEMYRYENINDKAQRRLKRAASLIARTPAGKILTKSAIDLVGDVVISLNDRKTAARIRKGLRDRILENFQRGNPCYLVAHSLGSIYAFDVINELMEDGQLFDRNSRRSWPVQAALTIGSPIGLSMFRVRGRQRVSNLGPGDKWFRWLNYWDRTDPVVSGNIFGKRLSGFDIAERFQRPDPDQGWVIRDVPVDTGRNWLLSHVAYWEHPVVGDGLYTMITN